MLKKTKSMDMYRRYAGFVLAFVFCQSFGIILFNILVDPYVVMNAPRVAGFNHIKAEINQQVRRFKALEVIRIQPQTVLLGSSRTEFGLDPDRLALQGNPPAYNLGLPAANMYEVRRYLEHAIANQPDLKTAAIGLDLLMFNQFTENTPDFLEARLETNHLVWQDILDSTFSIDALIASAKTIKRSLSYPNETVGFYYKDGQKNAQFYRKAIYGEQSTKAIIAQGLKYGVFQPVDRDRIYQVSPRYLQELQTVVTLCKEHEIDCRFFISPSHAIQWEAIRAVEGWNAFERWKREVVKILPVWDFSGYNSITTEPLNGNLKNYWDNSHYKQKVGDMVLSRIFGDESEKVPDDFGVLITPENIESHLAKIRRDREAWAKENPETVKFVENLKPSAKD